MTFSIAIAISGWAVKPLYVIILALLDDLSMSLVACDNADATVRPHLDWRRGHGYH
jgi:hypothetical protein